jgi:NADH dehydrogenase (ubiquinone) 1 alpha subcomplex subunit 9
MHLRNHNGELSSFWKFTGAEAAVMNITTAIFGCTGFVGKYVNGCCAQHRHTLILPFRFRSGVGGNIRHLRHQVDGTFGQIFPTDYELDKEFVVKAILEKVENVYNCIGAWQEPHMYEHSQSWFSAEGLNVEWPRMLARWCRELGINRLVHISMVGADVNSPSKILRQKALAEQAILEEFPRATIIRSTDMFSEDDWTYTRYLRAQRLWKITPVPNRGARIHQPVFVGDIAEAAARAVVLDHTEGRIAELGGPIRWTTNDLLRWCADCNGYNHYVLPVPKPVMQLGCFFNEHSFPRRGAIIGSRAPSWNTDWCERQYLDNVATPERDPDLLDWEDFGIPREDLFRMEEKYFLAAQAWSREGAYLDYGKFL